MTATVNDNPVQRRSIALTVTLVLHGLLVLFFILYRIITPIPPFPEKLGGGSGYELALGFSDLGMGENGEPPAAQATAPPPAEDAEVLTSEVDESDVIAPPKKNDKPKEDKPRTEKPKLTEEEIRKQKQDRINALMSNKGDGDGGKGTSTTPGTAGSADGKDGGTGKGTGVGVYAGPGINIEGMGGRNVKNKPTIKDKPNVGGKVVMDIVVDRDGKVIRATQNTARSTTLDQTLVGIARTACLTTTFTPDFRANTGNEQRGAMVFVFELE